MTERPPLANGDLKSLGADAWAILHLRAAIETGATLLAADRAEAAQIDRLDQLVDRMAEVASSGRFEQYRRADSGFTSALLRRLDRRAWLA